MLLQSGRPLGQPLFGGKQARVLRLGRFLESACPLSGLVTSGPAPRNPPRRPIPGLPSPRPPLLLGVACRASPSPLFPLDELPAEQVSTAGILLSYLSPALPLPNAFPCLPLWPLWPPLIPRVTQRPYHQFITLVLTTGAVSRPGKCHG